MLLHVLVSLFAQVLKHPADIDSLYLWSAAVNELRPLPAFVKFWISPAFVVNVINVVLNRREVSVLASAAAVTADPAIVFRDEFSRRQSLRVAFRADDIPAAAALSAEPFSLCPAFTALPVAALICIRLSLVNNLALSAGEHASRFTGLHE